MRKRIAFLLAILLLACAGRAIGARGEWPGVGGLDRSGVYFCPAPWNQFPYLTDSPFWHLRDLFSTFPIADC